ncbi:MAG: PfkB family carbohydrate kinase [Streptosporangiales bacterium]
MRRAADILDDEQDQIAAMMTTEMDLMAGNAGLLKHASNVPQTALFMQDLFARAGFPHGTFQTLLVGSARIEPVLRDSRVVAATLTGSGPAGQSVAAIAGSETQGAGGVVICYPDGREERIPAISARTVDATGAGDCFAGALSNYLRDGLGLAAAVRLAVAAAALSTRALGAQAALPTDAEVRAAARGATTPAPRPEA